VVQIVQAVLDVVARPEHVGRRPAPIHPVLEGDVGGVLHAVLLLDRRADDAAAGAGGLGGGGPPGREAFSKCRPRARASRASMPAEIPAPPAPMIAMSVSYCLTSVTAEI